MSISRTESEDGRKSNAGVEGSGVGIERIGQIAVNVQDLPRATAFYRDKLGLQHLFDAGHMSFFDCGGVRLMLTLPETATFDHPASIIYYQVPDIHNAYAVLMERGVEPANVGGPAEPHVIATLGEVELWMCFVRDTEGNLVGLMSEVPVDTARNG